LQRATDRAGVGARGGWVWVAGPLRLPVALCSARFTKVFIMRKFLVTELAS
jgi:hypothetical protein